MPRQPSFGLPFLARRDNGKFVYARKFPSTIASRLRGTIWLPWALTDHDLSGTCQLKLSLKTGDEATARTRWGQVNGQVEALLEATIRDARTSKPNSPLERREALTPAEIAALSGQVRHDLLSEHDKIWVDRTHMPTKHAQALKAAALQFGDAAPTGSMAASEDDAATHPLGER